MEDKWISVNDRLPECGGIYIVNVKTLDYFFTSVSYFDINYKEWEMVQSMSEYQSQEYLFSEYSMLVTHWKPLPEPPKE